MKDFVSWLNEQSSGEVFKPRRNKPTQFDINKHPELADEFYDLIATAYAEIGGHAKIQCCMHLNVRDTKMVGHTLGVVGKMG